VASIDSLLIYLEPSLVARVAAESFEFDSTRTVVPPLDGLKVPELRASAGSSSRKATGSVRRGDYPPRAHAPLP
jgi:hypothetical protein